LGDRSAGHDRRVIYARGFIQRHTVEINMDKIESVDVDQSIMGRAFNYGDVTIRGTGQTFEPLRQIDRPIDFRNGHGAMTLTSIRLAIT